MLCTAKQRCVPKMIRTSNLNSSIDVRGSAEISGPSLFVRKALHVYQCPINETEKPNLPTICLTECFYQPNNRTGSAEVLARLVVLVKRKQMFCNKNPEKLLKDNSCQNPTFPQLDESDPNKKAIGLCTEDLVYMEKIEELQDYLDKVKNMVKPGCSQEVLKVALSSMSSLVNFLSSMSTRPKLHASL